MMVLFELCKPNHSRTAGWKLPGEAMEIEADAIRAAGRRLDENLSRAVD